jgi:hypothetical protein
MISHLFFSWQSSSSFVPDCEQSLKPVIGMSFDSLDELEGFYKTYAHECGFSVRIGAQGKKNDVVEHKRFVCSREGFTRRCAEAKNQKKHFETRCGCNARVYVRLGQDKRYYIASFVEEHNHGLVSPDKIPFLRSNRTICQRAKTTLFTCHKASIGTSQAYRLLQVSDGFDNIGCMKRDLQNYYRGLREKIKNADAQLFVAQMERKKEANSAFFYDFAVDEHGKLVYIFWADATCRKNYTHFGDLVSVDATYSTNQYNMKFAPFTGVNHHMQSVFFGAAFLANEKIESYEWLFRTFLVAMGGKAPRLIITDEDASIKSAIRTTLPDTIHRLCMWHIMEKVSEKVGHPTSHDKEFWDALNTCVWGSETPEEFEMRWNALMDAYGLESNEWLANRYKIRESWIPAFFMDTPLAGVLRTTSRSESANSFFNRFIHRKLCFVEFWLRFDTTLECQRHEELKADHISIHSTPVLRTPWVVEKQASILYTHKVFKIFQEEVIAARDHCSVLGTTQQDAVKFVVVSDGSMRDRVVQWCTSNIFGRCSCKLFEKIGIPCCHIILAMRGEKLYILYFEEMGNTMQKVKVIIICINFHILFYTLLLDLFLHVTLESVCMMMMATYWKRSPKTLMKRKKRKKDNSVRNKIEEAIQRAKSSNEAMDFLVSSVLNIGESLGHIVSSMVQPTQEEYENFIGCKIPADIQIHPPNDVRSKGRSKESRGLKNYRSLAKERMRGKTWRHLFRLI